MMIMLIARSADRRLIGERMSRMRVLEKILEEIEEETKQEDAPIYCGDVEIDGYVRMSVVEDIIRNHMNDGWIPVEEKLPDTEDYILISFKNFSVPAIGIYEKDKDGSGAFYIGDELETCIRQNLYVNAWQQLPVPYRPKEEDDV